MLYCHDYFLSRWVDVLCNSIVSYGRNGYVVEDVQPVEQKTSYPFISAMVHQQHSGPSTSLQMDSSWSTHVIYPPPP